MILPVHKVCEQTHKMSRDQYAKIIALQGAQGPRAWSKEELALFRKSAGIELVYDGKIGPVPVIRNAADVLLAAWMWVRGMHMVLYRYSLPEEVSHFTRCPAPGFIEGRGSIADQRREETEHKELVLGIVRKAIGRDQLDCVRAWGGGVLYRCVWRKDVDSQADRWDCFWALDLSGASEWSRSVRGVDCPWYGMYSLAQLPDNASISLI